MRGRPPKVNKTEFLNLHNEGLSARDLAKHFNISVRHATRLRVELGVAQPDPHGARRVDAEWMSKAAEMLADGASVKEVATTLGSTEATVHRHFPGRGWDRSTIGRHARAVRTANDGFQQHNITPFYTNRSYIR